MQNTAKHYADLIIAEAKTAQAYDAEHEGEIWPVSSYIEGGELVRACVCEHALSRQMRRAIVAELRRLGAC
jgi:hypothetical protein